MAPTTVPQAQAATVAAAVQPTVVPTSAQTAQPTPATVPTAAPTPEPTTQATPEPTVDPAIAAEILPAYQQYWQVRDDALATLDGSHLSEVMDGVELVAAQTYLDQLRSQNKAGIGTEDHSITILSATPEDAVIHDKVVDHGIFVDPITREPLPPEQQAKPDAEIDGTYHLHKIDGVWKVIEEG